MDEPEAESKDVEEEENMTYPEGYKWEGKCLDDGTGRDVYYLSADGSRSRRQPFGYVPELLLNGERKYYYRKACIRCRKQNQPPVFLSFAAGSLGFSTNVCHDCLLATTPEISTLRGKGDAVYESNKDMPKNSWMLLKEDMSREGRDEDLLNRAKEAKHQSRWDMKIDRNRQRTTLAKTTAMSYDVNVLGFTHASYGFENVFNEYIGDANEKGEPHGHGVMTYSDGTIYFGTFKNGDYHTDEKGVLIKPTGATYEGNWYDGQKHGKGMQVYPDSSRYDGEFAKGYEHGQGKRQYNDGSHFEGRFRFGRKDGPGVMTHPDGTVEKGNFLDASDKYNEKAPPIIMEEMNPNEEYFQPKSLAILANEEVAKSMHLNRKMYGNATKLRKMVPEHMKYDLGKEYLRIMEPKGSDSFMKMGPNFAFNMLDNVEFNGIRIIEADAQALMYFQNSNAELKTLSCTANKMNLPSIDLICKNLQQHAWPKLYSLDLSFNIFDVSALQALMTGLEKVATLTKLRLAACGIKPQGVFVISRSLEKKSYIQDLDIAFNTVELAGAESLAEMLKVNQSLTSLNVRSNSLGALGGSAIAKALSTNKSLKILQAADNNIGGDIISQISGKLQGDFRDIITSAVVNELSMPSRYKEGRYDKQLVPDEFKHVDSDSD